MSFIRIVGTYNSANEIFHIVHFECPGPVPQEQAQDKSQEKNRALLQP
jgi:BTB/POZ domain-containing protein 9